MLYIWLLVRVCHKYHSMGLWKGLPESSQNNIRLSKHFGSPELITFPCLRLWGVSLSKLITSHMAFKQGLSMGSACFYFNLFLEMLMLSRELPAGKGQVCKMHTACQSF